MRNQIKQAANFTINLYWLTKRWADMPADTNEFLTSMSSQMNIKDQNDFTGSKQRLKRRIIGAKPLRIGSFFFSRQLSKILPLTHHTHPNPSIQNPIQILKLIQEIYEFMHTKANYTIYSKKFRYKHQKLN